MRKPNVMDEQELFAEIEKNENKRENLFKQKEPIDKSLIRLANRNRKLKDEIAEIKGKQKLDWEWLLQSSHNESPKKYRLRDDRLRAIGLASEGLFLDTLQPIIRVSLIKYSAKSLNKTLVGLKEILKYIIPSEGFKTIRIFEHSLCFNGSYLLLIDEKKKVYDIQHTQYHHSKIISSHSTLRKALVEIQDKHYSICGYGEIQ